MRGLSIYLLTAILFVGTMDAMAQQKRKKNKHNKAYTSKPKDKSEQFLKTQWWLGFKAGGNLTKANPELLYSGFSPINYDGSINEKSYEDFKKMSGQAGLEITFYHHGFSFSLQPNYRRQNFSYTNDYLWEETDNPDNSLELEYDQAHKIDYIEFPLYVKYDVMYGKLRPFVQVGAYYGTLVSATKDVEISGTDRASGGVGPFENQNIIIGADNLFLDSSIGLTGGIGVSYDLWNVRLVLDFTYRHGMNNVTNVRNRFSENQLSGVGDALDDIMFSNISFNIGCLFPLRFISKDYNSVN